jgi:hypothetical protein
VRCSQSLQGLLEANPFADTARRCTIAVRVNISIRLFAGQDEVSVMTRSAMRLKCGRENPLAARAPEKPLRWQRISKRSSGEKYTNGRRDEPSDSWEKLLLIQLPVYKLLPSSPAMLHVNAPNIQNAMSISSSQTIIKDQHYTSA